VNTSSDGPTRLPASEARSAAADIRQGGAIEVDTAPGAGTRVSVWLPISGLASGRQPLSAQ